MFLFPPLALALLLAAPVVGSQGPPTAGADSLLQRAERRLANGQLDKAREGIERALERDRKSIAAWDLRARWAAAADDADDRLWSLHQKLRLSVAQGVDAADVEAQRVLLIEIDPVARDLFLLKSDYIEKLLPIGARYEKRGRPHSAIRVFKQILAIDPENAEAQATIERIAAAPDPSLAADAKPRDLFEDVSAEWIREHDEAHAEWATRAKLERPGYTTYTDAGYEVLLRAGEAMEQMNAFYREFFQYGTEEDGKAVPRIGLNIFKNRDEYLELGIGPPVEWSGGHFTGEFVETYIGSGGFEAMTSTLFHEAAHQFVGLATTAVGWLNEGLASFFEGTRILPNGTVIMNMPATQRLFPLADRMQEGWMESFDDGLETDDPNATPKTAPTFRIVLENRYSWGPPWYAPTWGVVYFLYNFQDPVDGRFIYRAAFAEFINKSGGRSGNGAVENFEKVILAQPSRALPGVDGAGSLVLARTVEELDPIWRDWCIALRDELSGTLEVDRPYLDWGRYAAAAKQFRVASEHFEKGLVATPGNADLLEAFAELLAEELDNEDRAVKLVLEALASLESGEAPDEQHIEKLERWLVKLDPKQRTLTRVRDEMATSARALVARYQAAGLNMMVMDVSWRMGTYLELSDLFEDYERAVRASGKSLAIWSLAYNESDLAGWSTQGSDGVFKSAGTFLDSHFGDFDADVHDYQFLTLDTVTSGDFSMEAKILAEEGAVDFAGFVFGQKGASAFHGLFFVPSRKDAREGTANPNFVDLVSFYGASSTKIWRHEPIPKDLDPERSSAGTWRTLRLDIMGRTVDFWLDGELLGSHEFKSREVLRGRFGLVTGQGKARYRDVRYLARDSRDRAAALLRKARMEALESAGAVNYSYMGRTPPWPTVDAWPKGERTAWDEFGAVPQLLVFFSINQNEIVPIDGWLMALDKAYASVGLKILSVTSPNDKETLAAYLDDHPLPGAVAIDYRAPGIEGIGQSFEQFFIKRFNLPRVLLLDLDQTVIWEGDPGVILGDGLVPPFETYLDAPFEELLESRKLREVSRWTLEWRESGPDSLARGEFLEAARLLQAAEKFDAEFFPDLQRARSQGDAVRAALDALDATAASFQESGTEPALALLLEWGQSLGVGFTEARRKSFKKVLEGKSQKSWASALKATERFLTKTRAPFEERSQKLLKRLAALEGHFVRALESELAALAGDPEAFAALAERATLRPRLWLAREYFGW
jgi:tetratricopeptide (TPR) repeat protein